MLSCRSTLQGLSDSRHRRHQITYPIGVRFPVIRLGEAENDAGIRFYLSLLSQHAIILTSGPSEMHIPVASLRALAFVETVTTRRVSDVVGLSQLSGSPSNTCQSHTLRGCNVRLMLRPADSVGATDWVGQPVAALLGYRVGAIATWPLPTKPALYLFIQTGN